MSEIIEIPFGAKDSVLGVWEYNIPEGYTASIENDKIIVKKQESEDEKIRKAILTGLIDCRDAPDLGWSDFGGIPIDDCIAWLEKQGEQEEPQVYETEDGEVITYSESEGYKVVEPKFKDGDWVVCEITGSVYQIENCIENPNNHKYGYLTNGGYISNDEVNHYHPWTIQDAKDGDVLVTMDNGRPFIYKGCLDPKHLDSPVAYGGIDCEGYFCRGGDIFDNHWWTEEKVQPATREQSDLLFQKMKEAGYMWDDKKKEPKKIEQKPTWSEEDERLCSCLIEEQEESLDNVRNDKYGHSEIISDLKEMYNERIDWLKSLLAQLS